MDNLLTGKVKWFNNAKGYCFVDGGDGGDVFIHYSAIRADGYRTLKEGQEIRFRATTGPKGLTATEVFV